MLMSRYDIDRAFDDTIKRSLPYLIFSPQEFRNRLAEQMDTLCHYYQEKNDVSFPGRNEAINKMLDEAPEMDELTELKIHYLESHQKRIDERFWKIESRLSKLEKNILNRNMFHNGQVPVEKHGGSGNKIQQDLIKEKTLKPTNHKEIVLNYLKLTGGSHSIRDISENTELTIKQVSNAIHRLKKNNEKIKRETRNTHQTNKNGITRNVSLSFYSWIDKEQQ